MRPDVDVPPIPTESTGTTPSGTRGTIVARNVGLNFISQFWFAALVIVTTPYIVRNLGVDSYGLYLIISVVMGYFSFLDLGLGAALVKYISEYDAAGDARAVERFVRTGSGLLLVVGALGAAAIAVFSSFLVERVLTLGESEEDVARVGFYLGALGFFVNLPAQTFSVVPAALQRFDVVVVRTIAFGTAAIAGTIVVLALGYGLLAVLVVNLVITVLTAVSFYLKSRTLLPGVSFLPRISRPELRLLMGFGTLRAAQRISTRIVFQLDRLVVGAFAPIAAVTYYAVPLSVSQRIAGLVGNVGTAVFPAASALTGKRDDRRVRELYLRATKLAALIAIPIASIMFFYAHEIMRYWLGPEFEDNSSGVLMILAVANLLFAATTVPAVTLDAIGRIRVSTVFALIAAATNLVLVFALVPTIGFQGAAWAVLGNAAIMVPLVLYYVHSRVLEVSFGELFGRSLARPLLAAAVLAPAMIWMRQYATNLALVAVLCLVTLLAYVGLTVVLGAFDARDRSLLRSFVRR
jgi:O-antigen/teichoic acid export membrane protein